jgi:hypothetical protein
LKAYTLFLWISDWESLRSLSELLLGAGLEGGSTSPTTQSKQIKGGGLKMFLLKTEPRKEVRKDEGVDELTKLICEMEEGKRKLFLQLIINSKER